MKKIVFNEFSAFTNFYVSTESEGFSRTRPSCFTFMGSHPISFKQTPLHCDEIDLKFVVPSGKLT